MAKDPIFSSILYTMQLSQYLSIKKKARIVVPESCVVIGVVDEWDVLEEDEVFVQVRKENGGGKGGRTLWDFKMNQENGEGEGEEDGREIIKDTKVIVTRNPCTHPGDIRLLTAVDRPCFHHLFNCIVFSSKGPRPIPNMMAGGDLDGDVYFVSWNSSILANLSEECLCPPSTYSKPTLIHEKPDCDNIADYFIFYLERDVLGKLANMHLALCD